MQKSRILTKSDDELHLKVSQILASHFSFLVLLRRVMEPKVVYGHLETLKNVWEGWWEGLWKALKVYGVVGTLVCS